MYEIDDINNEVFYSPQHDVLNIDEVINYIKSFLNEDHAATYCLAIGTDSHGPRANGFSDNTANLVTAITLHRKGYGGIYFWTRKKSDNIHTLRDKIYAETLRSLDFASKFLPILKQIYNGHTPNLEIHVDVGEFGSTREMIKEIVGMVTGNGFVVKTKPYSYGASNIADRHT